MTRTILAFAGVAALASAATAQQARFLQPAAFSVPLGESVELNVLEGADPIPWPADDISYFFARTAWTQENRDTLAASGETTASWSADRPGVLMLGMELGADRSEIDAEAFQAYLTRVLEDEAREELGPVERSGPVTVVRTSTAVALVRVEHDGPWPYSVATSEIGMLGQIHPLMDPTALSPGSILAVEMEALVPAAHALETERDDKGAQSDDPGEATEPDEHEGGVIIATNATTGETVRAVANQAGTAIVPITHAGRWLLEFHVVARAGVEAEAPFLVHTTTLTFDIGGESDR